MAQPPSGDWPQQPPYGGQQPPYEQQPQYGQSQPPYGQPPYEPGGSYPPPPKRGNGFAVAGIILAIFAPLLGLIFSIIGLTKAKARAGAGRTLSIVGIVVSVIVMAGGVAAVVVLAKSTAADPGCVSAESAARQMSNTLNADGTAMTRDQNNGPALRTDLQHFLNDMRALQARFTAAEAQAQHQSVKTQIAAVTGDMSTFISSLQAVGQGDTSQVTQMETAGNKLQNDGNALDSTCTSL